MRRRSAIVFVALAVLLAACGGGKKKSGNDQYGSPLLSDTTTSVAPPATTAATVATTVKSGGSPASKPAPVTIPTPKPVAPTGDPVADASKRSTGDFAGMLLSKTSAVKKIIYELMEQSGLGAQQHTIDHVIGNLQNYSGKPVTVEHTPLPAGPSQWTVDLLHSYADKYTRFKSKGDTAVLHVLFVHGTLPGAAGVATRADVLSMFPDNYSGGGGTPGTSGPQIEDVVVTHETGHILGLVDLWLNDGRGDFKDDPAPGGHHSPNKRSVMYWRVETLDVRTFFAGGPPHEYDADDVKDLNAIHNGAPKDGKA